MNRDLQFSERLVAVTGPTAWTVGHVVALGLVIGMLLGLAEVFVG